MHQSWRIDSNFSSRACENFPLLLSLFSYSRHFLCARFICAMILISTGSGLFSQDLTIDSSPRSQLKLQEAVISPYLQTTPDIEIPSPNFLTMYYEFGLTEDLINEITYLLKSLQLDNCTYTIGSGKLGFVCYCHSSTAGISDNYWFQSVFHFNLDARSTKEVSFIAVDLKIIATPGSIEDLKNLTGRIQKWKRLDNFKDSQFAESYARSQLGISLRNRYVRLVRRGEE